MAAKPIHEGEEDKSVCGLCEIRLETSYSKCVDCDVYMCKSCTKVHGKLTSDHTLLYDQHGPLLSRSPKSTSSCSTHVGEELRYYCKTCELLVCSDCILSIHKPHDCSKVKDIVQQKVQKLSQTLSSIKDLCIPQFKAAVKNLETLQKENQEKGKEIKEKIKTRIDELIFEASKIAEKLYKENETVVNQNATSLHSKYTELSKDLANLESMYENFQKVVEAGSDVDKITAEKEAIMRLDKFKSRDLNITVQLPNFDPGDTDEVSLHQIIGFIDTGEEQGSDFVSSLSKENPGIDVHQNLTHTFAVNVLYQFNHQSKTIHSICPVTENTALIHCKGEFENHIVSNIGDVQGTLKLSFLPDDFVITPDGHIMATHYRGRKIHKMTMDGRMRSIISTAPLKPLCVCLSSDDTLLVTLTEETSYEITITDKCRRLVSRLNKNGQTVQTYEYNGESRLFKNPAGVDENINGDICVVDRTNRTSGSLIILDQKGRLKATYGGEQSDAHFRPAIVKCDRAGYIIVGDYYKKIHLLSTDGHLVQYIMTAEELADNPTCVAIDQQGLLWVGCVSGNVYAIKYLKH